MTENTLFDSLICFPFFKTIRGELNRLKQLLASEKQNERSMYQRMLADVTGVQGTEGKKKNNRTVGGARIKRTRFSQIVFFRVQGDKVFSNF